MGFYGQHIFPRMMDWVMDGAQFHRLRHDVLSSAYGAVLEVGIGTGLNLPHYPPTVTSLAAVDPVALLPQRVAQRRAAVSFPVHIRYLSAEQLPFEEARFDTVVSTWTLCSIPDPVQALREIRRVLKPTGRLLFLEHGRSDDERIARWQDRLNPIQKVVGCGCHLNRRIDALIQQSGLSVISLERFCMARVPRLGGEMYRGAAAREWTVP